MDTTAPRRGSAFMFTAPPVGLGLLVAKQTQTNPLHSAKQLNRGGGGGGLSAQTQQADSRANGNWGHTKRHRTKWWQSRRNILIASAAGVMLIVIAVASIMAARLANASDAAAAAGGAASNPYIVGDNKTVADNTTFVSSSPAPSVAPNSPAGGNSTAAGNSTAGSNSSFIPANPSTNFVPIYPALAVGDPPMTVPSGVAVELAMGTVTNSVQPQMLALWTSPPVGSAASGIAVARSYGDGLWEATAAGRAMVQNCSNVTRRCTVLVSGEGNLTLAAVRVEAPPSADQAAARLLMQGTFGPTLATIAEAKAMGPKAWLLAQAAMPATLHRAYFRARASAKAQVTSNVGQAFGPCDSGSRWLSFAFQVLDVGQPLSVTFSGANYSGTATLAVSGVPRTEIAASLLPVLLKISPSASITICSVAEIDGMGGNVVLASNFSMCTKPGAQATLRNPAISFAASPARLVSAGGTAALVELSPPRAGVRLMAAAPAGCLEALGSVAGVVNVTAFARADDGALYVYDARLALLENTVSAPAAVALRLGPRMTCPNVPKTFLNEAGCRASVAGACSVSQFSSALFRLDSSALRSWYTLEGRLVYAVSGLRLDYEPDPCAGGLSRWLRSAGSCAAPTALAATTNNTIFTRLRDSAVAGEIVHDMTVRCALAPENKGASLTVTELDGTLSCWRHVHPEEMNVYDFTGWSQLGAHPGNAFAQANGLPNPIAKFAQQGGTVLFYPPLHDMARWDGNKKQFPRLGRLGQTVDFAALPAEVQGAKVAAQFGAASTGAPKGGVVDVCGSPGESMVSPALGSRYILQQFAFDDGSTAAGYARADYPISSPGFKRSVFSGVVLTAPDQLRQRVAWALSQILVVTENQVDIDTTTEFFLQYYDILVRNAFGTYGDVLREVSYSPAMGEMLTYVNVQSLAFNKRTLGLELSPDENYARELMQLFTIGLYELETDGTRRADGAQTYSNDDITTFARAWTGFALQARRGNVESTAGFQSGNKIDPMRIIGDRRDPFPKRNLRSGYIGDGLPLCSELGPRPFLQKGARWSLLGATPLPLLQADPASFATTTVLRLSLNASTSALYRELCRAGPDGVSCTYPSIVELARTLPCDGGECLVDQPRVVRLSPVPDPCSAQLPGYFYERPSNASFGDVCREPMSKAWACPPGCYTNAPSNTTCLMQVGSGGNSTATLCRINDDVPPPVFYEYVRQPCVQLSFFSGGRRIAASNTREAICANPLLPLAGEACCQRPSLTADQKCEFFGERMTLATADKRCRAHWPAAQNRTQCEWTSVRSACPEPGLFQFFWSSKSCQVLAKLAPDGRIAIVHDVNTTFTREMVSVTNHNWFYVVWDDASSQLTTAQRCQGCQALSSGECLCSAQVSESQVFDAVPSLSEASNRLTLGAVAPGAASTGMQITGPDGVIAYTDNAAGTINRQTIFKLPGSGGWFRNARSDVILPSGAAFRNPPSFQGVVDGDARDAHHETKAVLDFFLYHSNTAPFMAQRLIQRLVTSNPSPRYVASVATAFRSGRFDDIGSGRYGCLLATVAAVLLDREARDASVDADPGAGLLREPILKLHHALRALEWVPHPRREIEWVDLSLAIGQQPYRAPSVFSFFKPESLLPGTRLASPEAEILTPPLTIRLLNGLMSLGKLSALTDCYSGLMVGRNSTAAALCSRQLAGTESPAANAAGMLAYRPPPNATAAAVVDQLALLLTAGKLANSTRAILEREYAAAGGGMRGLQAVLQLIFVAPEFHSTGLQRAHAAKSGPRVIPHRRDNSARPYKSIVYIFLNGGADSFSMLVPHSECRGGRDVYAEYATVRQNIAINNTLLLPIRPVPGTQVCDVMGLHPQLRKVRDMYNAGEAAILAGIGNLVEPLNKTVLAKRAAKVPVSLYAHNAQQLATMTVMPEKNFASGVLGRVADALTAQNFSVGSYTLEGMSPVLLPETSNTPDVVHWSAGIMKLDPTPSSPRILPALLNISAAPAAGVFSEYFAASLASALDRGAVLGAPLANVSLRQPFAAAAPPGTKALARQLQTAAKLMASRKVLGTDRDIFYATIGGFDTHFDAYPALAALYTDIDAALESFRQELVLQGLWNDTLVVVASEWGRTLTSNGQGTDHGWSGNYMVVGGAVKGAQVLGTFPESLMKDNPLDLGYGRMLPTTPWDAVWNAAAQWFGVAPERMDKILPNRAKFNNLFQPADMLKMP